MGVTERQLKELASYDTSDAFDFRERLVLDLVVAMAKTPTHIQSELTERLRQQFDQAQLVELAAAIAWEHYAPASTVCLGCNHPDFRKVPSAPCLKKGRRSRAQM